MSDQASVKVNRGRRRGLVTWLAEDTLAGAARRKALMGYIFLLPTILGILIFTAGPVVASLGLSLYQWNVFQPPVFIGLDNYARLMTDTRAAVSFMNTIHFVVLAVSLQIAFTLLLALAMQRLKSVGLRYYTRTAYFLPFLMSGAATAIVLGYMLHYEFGAVNYYLGRLGIQRVPWLVSPAWVLNTIVIAYIWQHMGFTLILFIGGLNNISPEILDAADVDGSAGWHRLWNVTLPMLSPTLLFAAVVGVIGALQIFDLPYVMTRGGPGDASRTAVMVMYESAFKNMEIGYGSSMAVILFALILAVTAFQFWLSKRWVFYQ